MKRRQFFSNLPLSVAGLSLASSCSNVPETDKSGKIDDEESQFPKEVPAYRNKIKANFSKNSEKNASDRVILALIGAGGWGTTLTLSIVEINKNVQFKYVCDVDPKRVRDMRVVFDDPEVDGVIIATPQHWHGLATIWACQAGKDVYIEKCVSFNIREGQKMIEAAMKYERIVQCGTQNRSSGYALNARDYIKDGKLGQVVAVNVMGLLNGPIPFNEKEGEGSPDTIEWNMWLGPAPQAPYSISRNKSWGYYWDYSGGYSLANGSIHQMDLARIVLNNPGFPQSVYCTGGRYLFDDQRDIPDYQMTTYDYGNFVLTLQTGECTPYMLKSSPEIRYGDGFPQWKQNSTKIVIYGTEGVMYVGRMGGGWQVFDKDRKIVRQESGIFPLKDHLGNYIDCIRTRNQPNGNIVEGHNSSVLVHMANYSYREGKKQLLFSEEYEQIINDQKAQALAAGAYREGFELPEEV
jgi:predicted dehydrogenase